VCDTCDESSRHSSHLSHGIRQNGKVVGACPKKQRAPITRRATFCDSFLAASRGPSPVESAMQATNGIPIHGFALAPATWPTPPVMASFNTMSSLKLHAPTGVGQVRIARGRPCAREPYCSHVYAPSGSLKPWVEPAKSRIHLLDPSGAVTMRFETT